MNYKLIAVFLLLAFFGNAQQNANRQFIRGKIISTAKDLENINIINKNTNTITTTEIGGYFEINTKEGDTLQFSSVQFQTKTVIVTRENVTSKELFFVELISLTRNLEEVIIKQYPNINAVSLGILNKSPKEYTVAERRLYTGTNGTKNLYGLNTSISFDRILNGITGKTKTLKKDIEVEQKETAIEKLEHEYDDYILQTKYKIPKDYIMGFKFFLVENETFLKALLSNNKLNTSFYITQLASDFLETIKP